MHACHGIDTPILMYNGDIKAVQDIVVGDQLMGDDYTPRTVARLRRGIDKLYEIRPYHNDPFICNEHHILSLWGDSSAYNISIYDYLRLPREDRNGYLYTNTTIFRDGPDVHGRLELINEVISKRRIVSDYDFIHI
jgi:hypothetical protein